LNNDLEQVLETALSGTSGVHNASLEQCGSIECEAHFEKLMSLLDGKGNKSPLPAKKTRRARVSDSHGDNENNIFRKGTGFVHLSASSEKVQARRAHIIDDHGDNENKILRKGTGFLSLGSSEWGKERHAKINDDHGDNENGILREGTGFIHLNSLPRESSSVSFADGVEDNVNHIQRNSTGFVFLKHAAPRVRIADSHGDNESRLQRKGTGYVYPRGCNDDLLPECPGSCSTRTVDPHGLLQYASDTDAASDECDNDDTCEEQISVKELK